MKLWYITVVQYNTITCSSPDITVGEEQVHKWEFCDNAPPVKLFELQFIYFFSLVGHSPSPNISKDEGLKLLLNITQNN